MSQNQAR